MYQKWTWDKLSQNDDDIFASGPLLSTSVTSWEPPNATSPNVMDEAGFTRRNSTGSPHIPFAQYSEDGVSDIYYHILITLSLLDTLSHRRVDEYLTPQRPSYHRILL